MNETPPKMEDGRSRIAILNPLSSILSVSWLVFLISSLLPDHRSFCLARVVDKNGFELGEKVETFLGHFALTDAGGFGSAEGQLSFTADSRLVDMHHAGFDLFDEIHNRIDILSEDRGREAIFHAIGELKRFFKIPGCRDR